MPDLQLAGCRSRPLLGYLKGLGILRVVSSQFDPGARVRWRDGVVELRSKLDWEQLHAALLHDYSPAPVVSPWNGGSGFYPPESREVAIRTIEESGDPRLAAYRQAVLCAREALDKLEIGDTHDKTKKGHLIRELRRRLPDEALPWLDAAVVGRGEDVLFPPLLGSGGNDGNYDFSNNYAQATLACVMPGPLDQPDPWLDAALAAGSHEPNRKLSLGHLNRDASPTNSPTGESDGLANPWDLVLAVEGTLLLAAGAARRLGDGIRGMLVAPFVARPTAAGYGSAAQSESGRAELWLPLWPSWASLGEIATLIRESRAQVGSGSRVRRATSGLDFARAAGELGVARGVGAFERYSILQRAGQSSLAVSVGRVDVTPHPAVAALGSIDRWLGQLLRFADGDQCPKGASAAIRRFERSAFQLASRGSIEAASETLEAMGQVELVLARSAGGAEASGLRPLNDAPAAQWLRAADDGSDEFRVASALASLADHDRVMPALRDYLNGTTRNGTTGARAQFDPDRRHAITGGGAIELLAKIHARRHLDASRAGRLPLGFALGSWCSLEAACMFAAGLLDDDRLLQLMRGLVLLDYTDRTALLKIPGSTERLAGPSVPVFEVLALAWHFTPSPNGASDQAMRQGPHPGWAARLVAGATEDVVKDAVLRLRLGGMEPILHSDDLMFTDVDGKRLAAALLLHLRPADINVLKRKQVLPRSTTPATNQPKEEE